MPPPGRPMLPSKRLHDRSGADDLRAREVMRPADRVANRSGALAAGVCAHRFGDLQKRLAGRAANLFHHFRRVALVVALQDLKDAMRILQRAVLFAAPRHGCAFRVRLPAVTRALSAIRVNRVFVLPLLEIVLGLRCVPAAEQTVQVLCVLILVVDDQAGVGVIHDVLAEVTFVLEDVANDAAQERNIRGGPNRSVNVGDCAGAREARIHVNDLRAALLRLHHPLETDRMILGHIRTLDQNAIGVLQILEEHRRATPTEAGPQTGDRGGVSNPGLVFDLYDAEAGEQLLDEIVLFVVERGAAKMRNT